MRRKHHVVVNVVENILDNISKRCIIDVYSYNKTCKSV